MGRTKGDQFTSPSLTLKLGLCLTFYSMRMWMSAGTEDESQASPNDSLPGSEGNP